MSGWRIGIITAVLAVIVSAIGFATLDQALASRVCLISLAAIPSAVFLNERLRELRARKAGQRAKAAAKVAQAEVDVTPKSLRQLLGDDNVTEATNLRLRAVGEIVSDPAKFGGRPDFLGEEQWPRCAMCHEPMTFIGQLPVGPEEPIGYSTEGRLYLFLCNADFTGAEQCETWDHATGCSACFVQPNDGPAQPFDDDGSGLAEAVRRNQSNTAGGAKLFRGIERRGERTYYPFLARQYVVDAQETRPSARIPDDATDEQEAHVDAVQGAFDVQIGGFGSWVQDVIEETCSCGAPMELLVQFDAFDEVLNLGDAGRAYVFGCRDRHAHDAFFVDWQCC